MKNICLINTNKAWGGGEKWHFEAALYLKSQGFNISVITAKDSELLKRLKTKNIKTYPFKISKLSFLNIFKIIKIKNFFKKNQFDSLILNLPQDAKCFGIAGKLAHINKIIYRRGMDHPLKSTFINKIVYKNFITDFIANSREVKKSIYKNIPELKNKIHLIYNSVSLLEVPPPKRRSKKLILGNLGRLVEQKGQENVLLF